MQFQGGSAMARVYVMKRRRSAIGVIIGIGVVIALLAILNPTIKDFRNYCQSRSTEYELAANVTGERQDYFAFSTFTMVIRAKKVKYLGVLKGVFVKI
jgi:hypothetical protein